MITENSNDHILALKGEQELALLIKRVAELPRSTLPPNDWDAILSAADLLIPRNSLRQKTPPSKVKLSEFKKSKHGRVIEVILRSFGSQETFDNNQRYPLTVWTRLLSKYYDLASYLLPPLHADFVHGLALGLESAGADEGIRFANLIQHYEPFVIIQTVTTETLTFWDSHIRTKLQGLIAEGGRFPQNGKWYYDSSEENSAEFDAWYDDATSIVLTARSFYKWAPFQVPKEIEILQGLTDNLIPPLEPEYEDDFSDSHSEYEKEYWTIERLFEDL